MKVTFVHDHKFPKYEEDFYNSYGFDDEFFKRYLDIFSEFEIIARETQILKKETENNKIVQGKVGFLTIPGYKSLFSEKARKEFADKIESSDGLIVRLPSILGLYSIGLAKKNNKPYIVEVVGCAWDAFWYQDLTKKIIAPVITYLTKRAVKNSKYVVYVTDKFLQKRYPTHGESTSCSNVTLHSVDDSILKRRLEKIDDLNYSKKIIIGTCATVSSLYKGQQHIIQAMAKLKLEGYDIEYQLVGGGNSSYLESLSDKLGIKEDILFLGKLKHEDVFNWLEGVDVYIQPSETEGLPRATIEAMSMGCPVIGSDAGGIPELINDEYIFLKKNPDDFCRVFKKLKREEMRKQAIENHEYSKKYLKSILYKKREDFFKSFITTECSKVEVDPNEKKRGNKFLFL